MNTRVWFVVPFLLFLGVIIASPQGYYTDVYLSEVRQARPPYTLADGVVFSYQNIDRPPRAVAVAFAHQNYTQLHSMRRNEYGVFLLSVPLLELDHTITEFGYLYIVDGIWVHDMHEHQQGEGFAGKRYSVLPRSFLGNSPVSPIRRDGKVVFLFDPHNRDIVRVSQTTGNPYYVDPVRPTAVFVAGSFNGWNPFSHPLERLERDGRPYYETAFTVPRGAHRYYFVVNGTPILDPLNSFTTVEPSGRRASFVEVE